MDVSLDGLITAEWFSIAVHKRKDARLTEGEHVEEIVRDSQDRSMRQVELVSPYHPIQSA